MLSHKIIFNIEVRNCQEEIQTSSDKSLTVKEEYIERGVQVRTFLKER
jgi:hypothetical protein